MPSSSSTASLVVISGMTEVEAASLLSRLRYMQKVGVLSEKVKYGQKNIDSSSSEGVSARQGRPSLPLGFIGA